MTGTEQERHDRAGAALTALLAQAAGEFDVGVAPVEAVVRGGRRRRARRWAVTAAAALVLAGGTGALAVTGLSGTDDSAAPAKPAPKDMALVDEPQISHVGWGRRDGVEWGVNVQVWRAPRDRSEAVRQMKAMADWGLVPATTGSPSDLIGRKSYFVVRGWGDPGDDLTMRLVEFDTVGEPSRPEGDDIRVVPQPLKAEKGPLRLVIGTVATTAEQVACHWKDGSTTLADRAPDNSALHPTDDAVIRSVHGYPTANWFVCVAPGSTTYESAEVTK
ncbi:hypothetical protein ACFY93_25275 [Streptomyces sp. NPDC008313]|uniref:hypothetical protein n=1 Tax=Streptomyces sp. NPDC008313 TaxID=3364826 RepID=UPI0036E3953C